MSKNKEEAFFEAQTDVEEGLEVSLASEHEQVNNVISTGSVALDDALFCGGLPSGRIIQYYGPAGCHAKGQKLIMSDGTFKNVEDVNVGDRLMGMNSEPRNVLELRRGRGNMYKITPVKGQSFVVNEDHILTLHHRSRNGTQTLVDKSVKEYLSLSKSQISQYKLIRSDVNAFESKVGARQPIDSYIMGLLIGDGSITKVVSLAAADKIIVKSFKNFTKDEGLVLNKYTQSNKLGIENKASSYIASTGHLRDKDKRFAANPIFTKIKNLGLNVTSEFKFIPDCYKFANKKTRLAILAGLIDTDGSMSHKCFDYISKSERLANDIVFVSRSVGLAAYVVQCKKKSQTGFEGTYFRVTISGNTNMVPTRLRRKMATKRKSCKNVLHTGFKVESVGVGNFYGFLLDGDHRYLMDDFTVSHNSGKTALSMVAIVEAQKKSETAKQLFLDAEGSFNKTWAEQLGVDLSRVALVQGHGASNGRKLFEFLLGKPKKDAKGLPAGKSVEGFFDKVKSGELDYNLVVLDSVGVLIPPQEDTAEIGKASFALLARFLGIELKKLSAEAQRANVPVILINHVREQMDPYAATKYTYTGGNQLKHQLSMNIMFEAVQRKDSQIFDQKENKIGSTIRAKIEKNKFGPWPRTVEFKLNFEEGIVERAEEILNVACEYDIIQRPNNVTYQYGEASFRGRDKALTAISDGLEEELETKIALARQARIDAKKKKV